MTYLIVVAAALSALWALVHTFVGGRKVAEPLKAAELEVMPKEVMLLCWHFVTGLLVLHAAFWVLALANAFWVAPATLTAIMISCIGVAGPPLRGQSYAVVPQGWLFVPIAAIGIFLTFA